MSGMMPGIISNDMASFSQTPPEKAAELKKRMKEEEAMRKRDEQLLKPKQLDAASKLVEVTKHEDEKNAKASCLRKINAYVKQFPERLKGMNVTPAKGAKASLDELEIMLADVEHQMGKSGGIDLLCLAYSQGAAGLEELHHVWNPLKLNLDHLGDVVNANMDKKLKPLFEEFAIKHENWFSSSVETRIVLTTMEIIAATNRMNSAEVRAATAKAAGTPADPIIAEAANKL